MNALESTLKSTLKEKRMSKAWKKWDSQMTNIIMSRPLGREWMPQLDKDGNPTGYLNLNTGHEQTEHSFMRYVKAYRKREFAKAQETLNERLNHLTNTKMICCQAKKSIDLF